MPTDKPMGFSKPPIAINCLPLQHKRPLAFLISSPLENNPLGT